MTTEKTEAFIADLLNAHPAVAAALLATNPDDHILALVVREICAGTPAIEGDELDQQAELAERLAVAAGLNSEDAELDCQLSEPDQERWKKVFDPL
jgi:hypothetical protein